MSAVLKELTPALKQAMQKSISMQFLAGDVSGETLCRINDPDRHRVKYPMLCTVPITLFIVYIHYVRKSKSRRYWDWDIEAKSTTQNTSYFVNDHSNRVIKVISYN